MNIILEPFQSRPPPPRDGLIQILGYRDLPPEGSEHETWFTPAKLNKFLPRAADSKRWNFYGTHQLQP